MIQSKKKSLGSKDISIQKADTKICKLKKIFSCQWRQNNSFRHPKRIFSDLILLRFLKVFTRKKYCYNVYLNVTRLGISEIYLRQKEYFSEFWSLIFK